VASTARISFWPDGSISPGNDGLLFVCCGLKWLSLLPWKCKQQVPL
jgi:hypothetical protein